MGQVVSEEDWNVKSLYYKHVDYNNGCKVVTIAHWPLE
jgi:hypothetical protein